MISRRSLMSTLVLAVASLTLPSAAEAQTRELKLATVFPPKHLMQRELWEPLAAELAKRTNGALTLRVYPAGALGASMDGQYKRAIDNVAEITYGMQGANSSLFRRTLMIELPGAVENNVEATNRLWDSMTLLQDEYEKTKILALWTVGPYILMSKKPVKSLEDIKGMKVRSPSKIIGDVLQSWGASPVNLPAGKIYEAMEQGVIDAAYIAAGAINSFKLGEVVKYYTVIPPVMTPMFLVMNKGVYDGLPADQKRVLDELTGRELSLKAARAYDHENEEALNGEIKSGRGQLSKLSPEEMARWEKLSDPIRRKVVDDLDNRKMDGEKLFQALLQKKS